jgi:hypothetical protein
LEEVEEQEQYLPLKWQNQERMDAASWSALARESRPPHWFSTAICSAVHRPNTRLMPSPSAAAASAESEPPPLLDAAMVFLGFEASAERVWALWWEQRRLKAGL